MEFIYKLKIDDNCDEIITRNLIEEMFDDMNDIEDYEQVSTINVYAVFLVGMGSAEIYTDKTIVKYAEELRLRSDYPVKDEDKITTPKHAMEYLRKEHGMFIERSIIEV